MLYRALVVLCIDGLITILIEGRCSLICLYDLFFDTLNHPLLSTEHCSHQEYIVDDVTYMRVKFYVDGSKRKGTVHVDLKKVSAIQSSDI